MSIYLDTFSVLEPTIFWVNDPDSLSFDILHGKLEQYQQDMYVLN
ncbi:MAG: hypothetical protein U5Q03_06030 [Bacteroidota bacterium]|nr:hypothetical protein [Bacteroidota bacterium]